MPLILMWTKFQYYYLPLLFVTIQLNVLNWFVSLLLRVCEQCWNSFRFMRSHFIRLIDNLPDAIEVFEPLIRNINAMRELNCFGEKSFRFIANANTLIRITASQFLAMSLIRRWTKWREKKRFVRRPFGMKLSRD